MEDDAFKLVKVEVVALTKPVAHRLVKPTLLFKFMVLPLVMLMLLPPCRLRIGVEVETILPEPSVAKKVPVTLGR